MDMRDHVRLEIKVTRLSNLKAHSDHAIQDITPPFGDA